MVLLVSTAGSCRVKLSHGRPAEGEAAAEQPELLPDNPKFGQISSVQFNHPPEPICNFWTFLKIPYFLSHKLLKDSPARIHPCDHRVSVIKA